MFYHIKNLQSTKTPGFVVGEDFGFITLRIYKVLKPRPTGAMSVFSFITLRIYKVLKLFFLFFYLLAVLSH